MSKRRRVTELAGGNPSIRLTPPPTGTGITLQPFPQIRSGHRINVDADILGKKTRQRLQASTFEIAVSVFRRSNHQGKTGYEAYRRLGVPVYESCHEVESSTWRKSSTSPPAARSASIRRSKSEISGAGSVGM